MQFVWKVAEGVSSSMQSALLTAGVYVVVVTILIATLKIKNDQ